MADANTKRRRGPKSYLTESARKRKKKESDQKRGQSRIYISKEIDRWRNMKEDLGVNTDSEFAKLLLDSYELHKKTLDEPTTGHMHSTPARREIPTRDCSESEVTLSGSEMSGVFVQVAESWKDIPVPGPSTTDSQKQRYQKADSATKEESSFINPFDLTIDVSENVDEDDINSDDEDYEPSFDITLMPDKCEDLEHLAVGDVEFGPESAVGPAEEEETEEEKMGPGIQRVIKPGESHIMTDDECFLTYLQPLLTLANVKIESTCRVKGCQLRVHIQYSAVGSAVYLKWVRKCIFLSLYKMIDALKYIHNIENPYNKKSGRWSAVPYKVEKKYSYINDLISSIVEKRLLDREGMHKSKILSASDPRHISSVLAPLPPPPTARLVEEKKSRMK